MNEPTSEVAAPRVRTGQGSTKLSRDEFERRYQVQFYDPAFDEANDDIGRITNIAGEAYNDGRKSARTRKAGPEFADPAQDLSIEWLETRSNIDAAQKRHEQVEGDARILVICASPRTDETCPSEMSKTFRIAGVEREQIAGAGGEKRRDHPDGIRDGNAAGSPGSRT